VALDSDDWTATAIFALVNAALRDGRPGGVAVGRMQPVSESAAPAGTTEALLLAGGSASVVGPELVRAPAVWSAAAAPDLRVRQGESVGATSSVCRILHTITH
jgi:hypothetical protein